MHKNKNIQPSLAGQATINLKPKSGFTLIEVLVVVAIIGLLSSVVLVGLSGSRARARDTRRIIDLKSLQTGLQTYSLRNGSFPNQLGDLLTGGVAIAKIPKDPSSGADYFYSYRTTDKQSYVLSAKTEATAGDVMFLDSNQEAVIGDYTGTVTSCAAPYYCVSF